MVVTLQSTDQMRCLVVALRNEIQTSIMLAIQAMPGHETEPRTLDSLSLRYESMDLLQQMQTKYTVRLFSTWLEE